MWHQIIKYEISQGIKAWKGSRVVVIKFASFRGNTRMASPCWAQPHTQPGGNARGAFKKPSEKGHWCEIAAKGNRCPWKGGAGCAAGVPGAENNGICSHFPLGKMLISCMWRSAAKAWKNCCGCRMKPLQSVWLSQIESSLVTEQFSLPWFNPSITWHPHSMLII